jgi:hypothetical protein
MGQVYDLWDVRLCKHIKKIFKGNKIIGFKFLKLFYGFIKIGINLLFLFIFSN